MKNKSLKQAIIFSVGYGFFTSISTLLIKLVELHTTSSMVVFFRFLISFIYIMAIFQVLRFHGRAFSLKTQHFGMHLMRAGAAFACQFALFYSLKYLPLVDANMLFLTHPLFVSILGALFLGIATNTKSWGAILIGFLGIIFILKPGVEVFNLASFIALSSGLLAAISILGVHELGKSEGAHTIMFYYFSITFLISGSMVLFNWKTPDVHTLLLLITVGIMSTLAQECSVRALLKAPAKIVAPLMYSTVVFSGILDWICWKNVPDIFSLLGILAICLGGTLTVLFAKKKSLEDTAAAT
jgi:drug/metabolite transporter (DMT)-like permease